MYFLKCNYLRLILFIINFILVFICFINNVLAKENVIANVSESMGFIQSKQVRHPAGLSITSMGQVHYVNPIELFSSAQNFQPKLAFEYDSYESNLRNNLLGMGFDLSGLDEITRCPSNLAQNGVIHGVDFSNQDRFCLRDEQLVAVKGEYGMDSTEYRLYHDDGSKIISYGRQGNSPANFILNKADGSTAYYGNTPDSQIKAQGKDSVAIWALSREKTANSEYFDAHYYKDERVCAFYPIEINYTGNEKTGVKPVNAIKFVYEDRSDLIEHYREGSRFLINWRLKEVQVAQSGQARVYKLAYEMSPNTSRSRLVSLQRCDNGTCYLPTQFTWQTNQEGWDEAPQFILPESLAFVYVAGKRVNDDGVRLVDLNGDGLVDMIRSINGPFPSDSVKVSYINNGHGWDRASQSFDPPSSIVYNTNKDYWVSFDSGMNLVDLNGDGLLDLIKNNSDSTKGAWINNGSGWEPISSPLFDPPVTVYQLHERSYDDGLRLVDLNGDGLVDLIKNNNNEYDPRGAWINNGSGWVFAGPFTPEKAVVYKDDDKTSYDAGMRLIDLNGDGLIDLIKNNSNADKGAWLNNGKKWEFKSDFISSESIVYEVDGKSQDAGMRFVDLNGDGLMDIVKRDDLVTRGAWINTGASWVPVYNNFDPTEITYRDHDGYSNDSGTRFLDLNGDGKEDMIRNVVVYDDDSRKGAWLNDGKQWKAASKYTSPVPFAFYGDEHDGYLRQLTHDNGVRFVDLDGNGLLDIVQNFYNSESKYQKSIRQSWLNKAKKFPDYLIGITEGVLNKYFIDYQPLSGKAAEVYTKEHDAKYPNMDWQGPMYVAYRVEMIKAGSNTVDFYHYLGMKKNQWGLGFLGFHQISKRNEKTGVIETVTYGQDVNKHNIGKVLASETRSAKGELMHSAQYHWDVKNYGDGKLNNTYYLPYIIFQQEK